MSEPLEGQEAVSWLTRVRAKDKDVRLRLDYGPGTAYGWVEETGSISNAVRVMEALSGAAKIQLVDSWYRPLTLAQVINLTEVRA